MYYLLHALDTCTLFRMHNSGYTFGLCPHIAHVSRLLKLKLFSPRLYKTYWQTPEVTNSEGI